MSLVAELSAIVHGGVLVAFALLFAFRRHLAHVPEEQLMRVFRSCGSILGLSLGAFILATVWTWPDTWNPGATGIGMFAVPRSQLARVLLFGAYWVSYTVLEIWTLDPCRLLDQAGVVADRGAYACSVRAVARQLGLNAALFMTVSALG